MYHFDIMNMYDHDATLLLSWSCLCIVHALPWLFFSSPFLCHFASPWAVRFILGFVNSNYNVNYNTGDEDNLDPLEHGCLGRTGTSDVERQWYGPRGFHTMD